MHTELSNKLDIFEKKIENLDKQIDSLKHIIKIYCVHKYELFNF